LIELGANASKINHKDKNALMIYVESCKNPSLEVLKLLFCKGSTKQVNNNKNTILYHAAHNRNCKV